MSVCSQCGCALPGLEHLCQTCYDAKYPELGQPKSLLESNWFALCYVICGVGLTWGLVVEFSSSPRLKPYHEYFYLTGWAVLTLFRLQWHAIRNKGAVKARQRPLPDWCLIVLCILVGLPLNWECAFLWFSRRYAFFSGPVIGGTVLIVAVSAAIALLVRLTVGNWRTALQVFAVASCVPSAIVVRLGLLR
jgi:hypothetical protein